MIDIEDLLGFAIVIDVRENETDRWVRLYVPMTRQTLEYHESLKEAWVDA